MTLEQAALILRPETSDEALRRLMYYGGFRGQEHVETAIEQAGLLASNLIIEYLSWQPKVRVRKSYEIPDQIENILTKILKDMSE